MKNRIELETKPGGENAAHVDCENCALDDVCRPLEMGGNTLSLVHDMMERRDPVKPGEYLYRHGEPIKEIYAVTSGTIKMARSTDAGREQVLGFRFPGELFGEEAMYPRTHYLDAIAVDSATVCRIPLDRLEELAANIPSVQRDLINLMSHQSYVMARQLSAYVARNSAEERLSAFLVNVAERNAKHSGSERVVTLAMSRDEIANFLGLRRETLSRSLGALQQRELIRVSGKNVTLSDIGELRSLAQF